MNSATAASTARPARTFAYDCVIKGWFRYGANGLLVAAIAGMTKFTHYAKLWERRRIAAGQGTYTEADSRMWERYQVQDHD